MRLRLLFTLPSILVKSVPMNRSGFTLIELLVVVAILAVLASILFPALRAAKHQTLSVICESNVKQLSMALILYEQENYSFPHGFDASGLPERVPPGGCPGSGGYDSQGWWWFHSISGMEESFEKGGVLWCPSRTVEDPYILCGNYGVNRAICKDSWASVGDEFKGKPQGLNEIRHPSLTLLITDSGYSLISWRAAISGPNQHFENTKRDGAFYVPGLSTNEKRAISPGFEEDATKGRHIFKTVNVGFTDGHIDRVRAERLLVEEANGIYKNRSPLWMPK